MRGHHLPRKAFQTLGQYLWMLPTAAVKLPCTPKPDSDDLALYFGSRVKFLEIQQEIVIS
jgi:hypothetical protein